MVFDFVIFKVEIFKVIDVNDLNFVGWFVDLLEVVINWVNVVGMYFSIVGVFFSFLL